MRLEDFDYQLPPDLIAQEPLQNRAASRMLVVSRHSDALADASFGDLPNQLSPGDVIVMNNSRVIPARLFGRRAGERAMPIGKRNPKRAEYLSSQIEVLLARRLDVRTWEALVRPGRKIRVGEKLIFSRDDLAQSQKGQEENTNTLLEADVIGRGEYGLRTVRFSEDADFLEKLEKLGHVPLPPYIRREDESSDRSRYQTVYAQAPGSVAAPTAGLHFTQDLLACLRQRGIETVEITLHVGLGTFQPIHVNEIEQHKMHPESFEVSPQAAARINLALDEGRKVFAVGTTTVRTLEHIAQQNEGRIVAGCDDTRLFILPGFRFRVVSGLLTNFHLPQTTLLMLISAFAGRERILRAYNHAVQERYRFYSYGDCMLIQ
jgi:S-adenosylmethionine:tRNA ribosyltransferase-isomerase